MSASLDEQLARAVRRLRPAFGDEPRVVQRFGGADAWLLRQGPDFLVLKRGRSEQHEADIEWEHDHLRRLHETQFPVPAPVAAFDGQSWERVEDRIWSTLTYLPGHALASEPEPDMAAAGAFLAGYHRASRLVPAREPRPTEPGLSRLREITPRETLRAALGSAREVDQFGRLLDDVETGLRAIAYGTIEHLVIHGDATNDNLIVDGLPPRIVGTIDFGNAHLAPWPADLGAALWRSGRAINSAIELDPDRVAHFVRGYHRQSPMPDHLARAVPLMIQARGLQLISRRVRRLAAPPAAPLDYVGLTLARATSVHEHRADLVAAITGALDADDGPSTAGLSHG